MRGLRVGLRHGLLAGRGRPSFPRRPFGTEAATQDGPAPPLRQRIQRDMLAAMRSRDAARASTLRMLYADLVKSDKSPSPADDVTVLQRYIQRLDAAIGEYGRLQQGSVGEMRAKLQAAIDKEQAELEIIRTYLPAQYTEAELREAIGEAVAELGALGVAPHPGAVIKALLARLDHSRVNKKALAAMVSQSREVQVK